MDIRLIKKISALEREVARLKVIERLVPETMGLSAAIGGQGLRGLWNMTIVDSSGNCIDASGHGHTLSYNGNPVYDIDGKTPFLTLDGTGDYLSRADEADLDITGTEAYMGTPGLTVFQWIYFDNAIGSVEGTLSKWDAGGNDRSYQLYRDAAGDANFEVSTDGTAVTSVDISTALVTVDTWYFIAGRFTPSTELKIWINTNTDTNTTAIPASINSGAANLYLGAQNGSNLMTGRLGQSGLYASALDDTTIGIIFEMTRGIYGV